MSVTLLQGDCIEVMKGLEPESVDAIVSDPPYGLEFMGKGWDAPWKSGDVIDDPASVGGFQDGAGGNPFSRSRIRYGRGIGNPAGAGMTRGGFTEGNGYANRETPTYGRTWQNKRCVRCGHIASGGSPCTCEDPEWVMERGDVAGPSRAFEAWVTTWAKELHRILKPGGYALAFGGTRMYHRLANGMEDAGFLIEGCAQWLYGSGFPKSLDVAKAMDKQEGIWRGRAGEQISENGAMAAGNYERTAKGSAVTEDAQEWEGWGTALKPAWEPIVIGRKS
jgi:hypothetical protein